MTTRRDIIKGGAGLATILAAGKAPAYISSMWGARNALMTEKRLPYDAEVEYLESTGTQWIDTRVYGSNNTDVEIETMLLATSGIHTVINGGNSWKSKEILITFNLNSGVNALMFGKGTDVDVRWGNATGYRNKRITVAMRQWNASVDGEIKSMSPTSTFITAKTLCLFTLNRTSGHGEYLVGRIYMAKIVEDGILVRDFIPVRVGTKGAMYDKRGVGGMNGDGTARNDGLYFNRGTGNFGYGNDK